MRRWGIAIVVALAAIAAAPTAHADVPPQVTYGTAAGWMDEDLGNCSGRYDLDGHFEFRESPAVDTVALLTFSDRCPVNPAPLFDTNGTIEAPKFSGSCYVAQGEIPIGGSPLVVAPVGDAFNVECSVRMANGDYAELDFDLHLPLADGGSQDTTGIFTTMIWIGMI